MRIRPGAIAILMWSGCADPPPPPPKVALPAGPLVPLDRICEEALPLRDHTVGEMVRTLRGIAPKLKTETRPCDAGTAWPIAFAESEQGRPPVGITVLHMEGDVLLTFEAMDREAPTVKACAEIDVRIDDRHRARGVALWVSDDDKAFDPAHLEASTAELAWLELLSKTPGDCTVGRKEAPGQAGEAELRERLRACAMPNFVTPVAAGCDVAPKPYDGETPSAGAIEKSLAKTHRYTFTGREAVRDPELKLVRTERCAYEPPPATRDVCFAVYERDGERWYGRGDVTRTGVNGQKNYVDSYLTFQLLKRLEAERKGHGKPSPPAPGPVKK